MPVNRDRVYSGRRDITPDHVRTFLVFSEPRNHRILGTMKLVERWKSPCWLLSIPFMSIPASQKRSITMDGQQQFPKVHWTWGGRISFVDEVHPG